MLHNQQQDSESSLMQEVFKLSDAGASVIQVRSREPIRAAVVLRKGLAIDGTNGYKEWDCINGYRVFTGENYMENITQGLGSCLSFGEALEYPLKELRKGGSELNQDKDRIHYFIYVNAHPYMNPMTAELIQQYAALLPAANACLIFITPEISLDLPQGTIMVTEMKTPNVDELETLLRRLVDASARDYPEGSTLSDEDFAQIAQLGLGMTLFEFETYTSLAIIQGNTGPEEQRATSINLELMLAGISTGKTEVVKQSDILELYPSVDMAEVGGMQRMKDWIDQRRNCFTDEAREFGIEPPKGVVVVGVPGTGKSLVAKAVASSLGIPLIRLDMGRVFSKFVGDSESRMRAALKQVEAMSPCVLFVDEIDKGMGGAGGGGDSGTSSRVLGTFLTWLNDCKAPVFNMVTANRVQGLPPELLRKGRFDQIFSVTLPTASERVEVLQIHMAKRGHAVDFSKQDIERFRIVSDRYVPAEIEQAVKDALILAFNEGEALSMAHVVAALKAMVPMSKSNAEQVSAIIDWAEANAIPVNYGEQDAPATAEPSATGAGARPTRRINRRS